MQKIISRHRKLILVFGMVSFLFGCSKPVYQEETLTAEARAHPSYVTPYGSPEFPAKTSTPKKMPKVGTLTPTLPPTSTSSLTPTPTNTPTDTPTPTSSPTPTFVPTLHPDEALQVVNDLFKDNGGCVLPCWWGIYPGVTSLEEVERIFLPISKDYWYEVVGKENVLKVLFSIPAPEKGDDTGHFSFAIWVKDDSIFAISVFAAPIMENFDTSLAGMLGAFGQPEEIRVYTLAESTGGYPPYELDLFYSEKGLMLSSAGQADDLTEDAVVICPIEFKRGKYPPVTTLFSPGGKVTYSELVGSIYNRSVSHSGSSFQLLGELTDGFDEAEFYRIYSDPNAETCINIQIDRLQ